MRRMKGIYRVPEGFSYKAEFITKDEEQQLLVFISTKECLITEYPQGATIGWHRDAFILDQI